MSARLRRSALTLAALAALAALEWLWRAHVSGDDARVLLADFGMSNIVGGIISAIGNLFGGSSGRVDFGTKKALADLSGIVKGLGEKIVEGLTIVAWEFARVWDWLKRHIERIARGLYDVIVRVVQRLRKILGPIIGPIIEFLKDVRDHVWKFYTDFVKPVLDIIEFIRLPLRILSGFNVEWAKRLDATLANLEDWITDNFRLVMGKLNQAIDFLDQIVDVTGLLKRYALMNSLLRDIHIQSAMWWRWRFKLETPEARAARNRRLGERTVEDAQRDTATVILTGDGPYGATVREMSIQWRLYIEKATG